MHPINGSDSKGLTLTIVGCGTLGSAILSGILQSLSDPNDTSSTDSPSPELPSRIPSRFIACNSSKASITRLRKTFPKEIYPNVDILQNANVQGVNRADVVLLACKPQMAKDILTQAGMRDALRGKLLISILAGTSVSQFEDILGNAPRGLHEGYKGPGSYEADVDCRIVRVMPNTAALIRQSMTVIATSTPPLPQEFNSLVTWIFLRIGSVRILPPSTLDTCTALCGSGPAFFALMLEAMADGAVAMGLPRADAQFMAAQTMKGTAGLVLNGEHPAVLRDKVSTPGGCTIGGLLVLEEGSVRGTLARGLREAAVVASLLGEGKKGVNGTRFGGGAGYNY